MFFDIVLVIVLVICFITDLNKQKIYNVVIFPALIIAIILNVSFGGFEGLKLSLIGFLTGLGILLIPYLMGGMGAGDVKLLAFIGTMKGSLFVLNTAMYMGLIGGVIAIAIMLSKRELLNFFKSLFKWFYSLFIGVKYKFEFAASEKYPYGTAIALGAFICLFFKEAWII